MKNISSKQDVPVSNHDPVLKVRSSANVSETRGTFLPPPDRVQNPVIPTALTRKTNTTGRLRKTLSRSQDSLMSSSLTPKAKVSSNLRIQPQSALGLHNTKSDIKSRKKSTVKVGISNMNNIGGIRRTASKDSIDSNNSKEREKENFIKCSINNKKNSCTIVQLEKERKSQDQRISELVRNAESKKAEIATLKMEMNKLKSELKESNSCDSQYMLFENKVLRDRLTQLGFSMELSALSDSEKEILLKQNKNPSAQNSLDSTIDASPDFQVGVIAAMKFMSVPSYLFGFQEWGKSRNMAIFKTIASITMPIRSTETPLTSNSMVLGGMPESKSSCSDFGGIDELGEGAGCSYNPMDRADWDKQSNSSVSEMSVACLQDRITQMEENHYSTNEELQATLQELSDLQDQLTDLQLDNEHLKDEKSVMLESLCSQTEKLEECRSQICSLKQLLFNQSEDNSSATPLSQSEREQKLIELLKSAELEKESHVTKYEELVNNIELVNDKELESEKELDQLQEQNKVLELTIESINSDKKVLEKLLSDLKDQVDSDQIEIARITTLFENERQKVQEVQEAREAVGKNELDRLIDSARKEKDKAESRVAELQEQLSISQCEVTKLKEQMSILQDETTIVKNNAKKHASDLNLKIEQIEKEKNQAEHGSQLIADEMHELEMKCQRHLEDKRDLKLTINELQNNISEAQEKLNDSKQQYEILKKKLDSDTEEWKKFQDDLLTTVRVANEFKTDAQTEIDILTEVNEQGCNTDPEAEDHELDIGRLQNTEWFVSALSSHSMEVLNNVEQDLAARRQTLGGKRGNNQLSVKGLIESIESATKQAKAQGPHSRSSSTSSLSSCTSESKLSPSAQPVLRRNENDVYIKASLRPTSADIYMKDKKISSMITSTASNVAMKSQRNLITETMSSRSSSVVGNKENSDPSQVTETSESHSIIEATPKPVSILSSKFDPLRRNSYGDIGDKKDPLATLAKNGGSKRNALLKWCQNKVVGYKTVDITNFSSSWNDGLAFCALLHSYLPDKIPYDELDTRNKKKNFTLAFQAAESAGISSTLIKDLESKIIEPLNGVDNKE
ncbi:Cytospin-A [Nymphon striatum]|nr:Cytospin-A [Nymphon striatum]